MISTQTLRQLAHRKGQLIYLGLSPDVRLCSRGHVDALGQSWTPAGLTVEPQVGPHGVQSITISLDDTDYTWSARLRREFVAGIACQWYLIYSGPAGWEWQQFFSGTIDAVKIPARGDVKLIARVATGDTAVVPRVPFYSPHSLARGSERVINGTTYRVE